MGTDSDTKTGTLYVNGEPVAEVKVIELSFEAEPLNIPPILKDSSITFIGRFPQEAVMEVAVVVFQSPCDGAGRTNPSEVEVVVVILKQC